MDFNSAFSNRKILIPSLQRDYVQGATESVIVPFLDSLMTKDVDLNYIYGYEEDGAFVPVDGQQRLITLWLLHLYVWSRTQTTPFTTSLSFQTREFASEFCDRLASNLRGVVKELIKTNKTAKSTDIQTLDKAIKDCNWFISAWNKNATVVNMLRTLKYIHNKTEKVDIDNLYARLFSSPAKISFAFLNMTQENGLDDDIYIKMNGRGRPLSAFENLKSWMDQRVDSLPLGKDWKILMDNRWTNLFWNNRDKNQEHPEEIDDEQLHLFCNLLYLFHTKNSYLLLNTVATTNLKEELIEYLDITDPKSDKEVIVDAIFKKLAEGQMPSLIWIERLGLMPDAFFRFAFSALNRLCERGKGINESKLYFVDSYRETTSIYNLSMTKATVTRTLPLLYTVLSYLDNSATSFYDWMRVLRNLIINIDADGRDALPSLLAAIDLLSLTARDNDLLAALSNYRFTKGQLEVLEKAFTQRQLDEEKRKAAPEYIPFRELFADLENLRFFAGRINALFSLVYQEALTISNVQNTVKLLKIIFDGGDNGVTSIFDDNNHYLRRALISYDSFGIWRSNCWCFCNGLAEWRSYVRSENDKPEALKAFVEELAPLGLNKEQLLEAVKEKVEAISRNYLKDIAKGDESTYRFHFTHHPGVWSYMNTQLIKWGNDGENSFDIVLKKNDSNNSNRMELRTYALYLDYDYEKKHNGKYAGWYLDTYESCQSITCFYFQRKRKLPDGQEYDIAIDVFFYGVDGKRDSENCYGLNVFLRDKHKNEEDPDEPKRNQELLDRAYGDLFEELGLTAITGSFRHANSRNLSREEVIAVLGRLLSSL